MESGDASKLQRRTRQGPGVNDMPVILVEGLENVGDALHLAGTLGASTPRVSCSSAR
jgi:hypothetical protein